MAGMDWFRWHHGSVTDPKFALVARKAGASLPDVLAVWAYILETASQSVERGDFGTVDCEALDCVFGFPATETRTQDILKAMADRELTTGNRINAWEKRQPKREREDSTNADRQATFRAKKNQVTPSNATQDQKTPREEKSREEKSSNTHTPLDDAAPSVCVTEPAKVCKAMKAAGIGDVNPGHPDLLMLLEAGATVAEFEGAARTASGKGKGFAYALGTLKRTRQDAANTAPTLRTGVLPAVHRHQPKTFAERDREAGMARWEEQTGRIHPDRLKAQQHDAIDVTPRNLEIAQ